MRLQLATIVLAVCIVATASATVPTVSSLNITAYMGRWYEAQADALVMGTFQKGGVCATADYFINDQNITVINSQRQVDPQHGAVNQRHGWAYQPDASKYPGRLLVHLNGVPVLGAYWIIALGEQDWQDGQYRWAIVSDSFLATLFVLVRDVPTWEKHWKADTTRELQAFGFGNSTKLNAPLDVNQTNCNYIPPPKPQLSILTPIH